MFMCGGSQIRARQDSRAGQVPILAGGDVLVPNEDVRERRSRRPAGAGAGGRRHGGTVGRVTGAGSSAAGEPVEVVVVGAGPAGAAAAIESRRLGLDVVVIDRAQFPRDKTCGDGLTTGALRRLEALGVDVRRLPSYASVRETVLVSPSGREVALPLPPDGEYAGVAPRVELDDALVHRARDEGAQVRDGVAVTGVRPVDDAVQVVLDNGHCMRAQWVVAADGHYSPVRRLLGEPADDPMVDLGTWHAFRQYFRGVDDERLWVVFDPDLLPGYAWVFPIGGGRANVGFGVLRTRRDATGAGARSGKRLADQWRDVVAHPKVREILGPRAEPEGSRRAWPIPASFDADRLARGRVLFAGDAANVVDPMTGEGIAQAIDTGLLAARAIEADATPPAVRARYRRSVASALRADLRFAAALQQLLRTPLGARCAIRAAGLTPWTRRNFARWMFEDYPRAVMLTPGRWHRGMFVGRGAYAKG
jgi:geranylgeranyl reductase family protein